jgi:hypothetical protein
MKPKVASLMLSGLLVVAITGNLYEVFVHGIRFVGSIPGSSPIDPSLIVVAMLAIICGSDLPAQVRGSRIVRVQLQCWVLWLSLVIVIPFSERYLSGSQAEITFCALAGLLAIYSVFALFRPHDLFSL